jgi:hypothetical protein
MSSVVISGDTSGAITLSAPAVAGTNTLTLPASTGTVLTTGSPQSGGVIQVVGATSTTNNSTTSTSFVATNLTATITPKFSTSRIFISVSGAGWSGTLQYVYTTIARNSTVLTGSTGLSNFYNNDGAIPVAFSYLDSPATTSATTYTVYFRVSGGTGRFIETTNGTGTITLMEIAA